MKNMKTYKQILNIIMNYAKLAAQNNKYKKLRYYKNNKLLSSFIL